MLQEEGQNKFFSLLGEQTIKLLSLLRFIGTQ
ncbi:hypothetical protein SAMN05216357_103132 [Porphyromonadaceae bacterium KH3CP3RA]|nr:hypothetical protein SAMN05216357_103132 [Porphyromonadaceae bacterium KH3CP3RA]